MGLHVAEIHVGGYYIVSFMSHFAECHVAGYIMSPQVSYCRISYRRVSLGFVLLLDVESLRIMVLDIQ
jgi:hypothetical protein